jgi:hypothetical protein
MEIMNVLDKTADAIHLQLIVVSIKRSGLPPRVKSGDINISTCKQFESKPLERRNKCFSKKKSGTVIYVAQNSFTYCFLYDE